MIEKQEPSITPSETSSKGAKGKSKMFWRCFWLTFLAASLCYAWYSFYVPSNDVDWVDDIASAQQRASDTDKNILLFFTAEWCVPCRIMKRQVFADPEVVAAIKMKVVPVMIHTDDPRADKLCRQYNVDRTPITIFTDSHGDVLDYAVGKVDKAEFLGLLENLSSAGL